MTEPQAAILGAIVNLENGKGVRSLFQVAAEALKPYWWAWHILSQLEGDGLVVVERNGLGLPLRITSTEKGKQEIQKRRALRQESLLEAI